MKTKIVYVLVCRDSDFYLEMTQLSLYSLRQFHPKATVEVVMDESTYSWLKKKQSPILSDVSPIAVTIPFEYDNMQYSRYLKTHLRQLINEDFLYLDCDTLVCGSLDEIDKLETDIAMVANYNLYHGRLSELDSPRDVDKCKKAGFLQLIGQPYYNGGVMYVKDTSLAYKFFNEWQSLWMESLQNGISQDQPALCQSNVNLGFPIRDLTAEWNCQIRRRSALCHLDRAKLIHYYTWALSKPGKMLMKYIKRKGKLTNVVTFVAKHPRTIGYLVFTKFSDETVQCVSSIKGPLPFRLLVVLYSLIWRIRQRF